MKTLAKIRAIGGSLVATIPKEIVNIENLEENQVVEIEIKKHKKDFFGTLKGLSSFTEEDRIKSRI